MSDLKPRIRLLMATFMIIYGCNTLPAKNVLPDGSLATSDRETVVFGRLRIIENGIGKTHYKGWTSRHVITLVNIGEKTTHANLDVRESGAFVWKIPRGNYLMTRVTSYELKSVFEFYPQVAFQTIPGPPGETQYLGTLQIRATTKGTELTTVLEDYQIAIIDEFGMDAGLVVKKYRKTGAVLKKYMIHDARLPKITPDELDRDRLLVLLYNLGLVLQYSY